MEKPTPEDVKAATDKYRTPAAVAAMGKLTEKQLHLATVIVQDE